MSPLAAGQTPIDRANPPPRAGLIAPTLVSDFCEGAPLPPLIAATRRLAEARVTLLGLAALDDRAQPDYDHGVAGRLSEAGMDIAALTPDRFAQWLAGIIR